MTQHAERCFHFSRHEAGRANKWGINVLWFMYVFVLHRMFPVTLHIDVALFDFASAVCKKLFVTTKIVFDILTYVMQPSLILPFKSIAAN